MPHLHKVPFALRGVMAGCITMGMAATASGVEIESGDIVKTMPKPDPHHVWVYDPDFPNLTTTQAFVVDGDKGEVLGMVDAGYQANLAFSDKEAKFWIAETYYSRITRGERSDMVTVYDHETLAPQEEIPLPEGRFLVVSKRPNFAVTDSDRYLLSFNSTPATTVSVIDPNNSKYMGEISVPGCSHVYPSGESRFAMLCPDGSLASVSFDDTLKADIQRTQPFLTLKQIPSSNTRLLTEKPIKYFLFPTRGTFMKRI
ncbi:amine dehydrogenase large subunit [Modicisalibacter luteus]|uniref:amine dehydrogenase large subunit n=1 Tax=Modicisalibacter luteus TaxID=453962 RepID=UPI003643D114